MHQSQQTLSLHLRLPNLAQALLVKVVQRNPQSNLKGKTTNPQTKKKMMMRKTRRTRVLSVVRSERRYVAELHFVL